MVCEKNLVKKLALKNLVEDTERPRTPKRCREEDEINTKESRKDSLVCLWEKWDLQDRRQSHDELGLNVLLSGFNSQWENNDAGSPRPMTSMNLRTPVHSIEVPQPFRLHDDREIYCSEAASTPSSHSPAPVEDMQVATVSPSYDTTSEEEEEDENTSYPGYLPASVYRQALNELTQGAKQTMQKCMLLWRSGQLQDESFKSFVESIQWQSPTLTIQLKGEQGANKSQGEEFELLSAEDMAMLAGLANQPAPSTSGLQSSNMITGRNGSCFHEIRHPAPKKQRKSPILRPICHHSTPSSSSSSKGSMTQADIHMALDVVSDDCILDSAKTLRLTEVLVDVPQLAFYFEGCWHSETARFVGAPDWKKVEKNLLAALPRYPSHVSSLRV